jgi:2-amino-4-hydroxy-6-hydroxymethyldihydropteridine diphosphokinase
MNQGKLVYIGLGTNLGNRKENIKNTLSLIKEKYSIIFSSNLYSSEPWGYESDAIFINSVICIETNDDPMTIFYFLKNIESKLGRKKSNQKNYEDRIIDLDILFYNDETTENEIITIPHVEIQNRRFVLEPMNEIAPNYIHPILKKPIYTLLKECKDQSLLEQIDNNLSRKEI